MNTNKISTYRTVEQKIAATQKRVDGLKSKIASFTVKLQKQQSKLDSLKKKSGKSTNKALLKQMSDADIAKMLELWQKANVA